MIIDFGYCPGKADAHDSDSDSDRMIIDFGYDRKSRDSYDILRMIA